MPRQTLGYVQLEWTCPNCNTRNKGGLKTCANCGAPQPENVQFEAPIQRDFVKDENEIKVAQAGADIHCGFCGTRNPATATTCSQCGADLKEGKARQTGREMQAPPPAPKTVICTNCGTENPSVNQMCSKCGAPLPKAGQAQAATSFAVPTGELSPAAPLAKKPSPKIWLIVGGIFACLAVLCVAALALFVFPSSSVQATVTDVYWQTFVPVQEVRPVTHTNERGSPPSDAYNTSCHNESRQVCEQKTIDKGNGYAEVVEECHTETEQYCSYTVDEWQTIQTYTLDGNDPFPQYADPTISGEQRVGSTSEELTVTFSTSKGEKTYKPGNVSEFQQFEVGSTWSLKLNAVGGVVSVTK